MILMVKIMAFVVWIISVIMWIITFWQGNHTCKANSITTREFYGFLGIVFSLLMMIGAIVINILVVM